MAAYNGVNGAPMTENDLLAEPLKGEWGFDGVVVSDWGAVYDGEPAARAALDLAMPGPGRSGGPALVEAVRAGRVPEDAVDAKVRRLLLLAARAGALEGVEPRPRQARARPDRGRLWPRPRGRVVRDGAAAQRRHAPARGRRAGPRRRRRPRRARRPAARRRLGQRAAGLRRDAGRRPAGRARRPRRGGHRRRRGAVRRAALARGPTSSPARTARRRCSCAGSTTQGARSRGAEPPARRRSSACSPTPLSAPPSSRSGPPSRPTRTANGGSASSAGATATLLLDGRRGTRRRGRRRALRRPPGLRRTAAARHRRPAAGRAAGWTSASATAGRPRASSSRSASSSARRCASGGRRAGARGRAGPHQRRRGRRRRHVGRRRERGLRPDVAGAARAGRTSWSARSPPPTRAPSWWSTPVRRSSCRGGTTSRPCCSSGSPAWSSATPLADVLLGAVEPGGRLPTTWPAAASDAPVLDTTPTDGRLEYAEGLSHRPPRLPRPRHRAGVLVRARPRLHDLGGRGRSRRRRRPARTA